MGVIVGGLGEKLRAFRGVRHPNCTYADSASTIHNVRKSREFDLGMKFCLEPRQSVVVTSGEIGNNLNNLCQQTGLEARPNTAARAGWRAPPASLLAQCCPGCFNFSHAAEKAKPQRTQRSLRARGCFSTGLTGWAGFRAGPCAARDHRSGWRRGLRPRSAAS